jgi:DNA modification methylase
MIPENSIICGDCIEVMREWTENSIDCCVTSPPYWGLRDYGCYGQIGLEKTPQEFVAKMVAVFAEVHRVLKPEGTLWLNLGDSYANSNPGSGGKCVLAGAGKAMKEARYTGIKRDVSCLKPKDLCGIPWRVALALQEFGWYLRQDIIWHKPNPMPESVRDRCTKAHEYIFLLTKSARYFYDAEAIKEDSVDEESYTGRDFRAARAIAEANARPHSNPNSLERECCVKAYPTRNKRSVWTVTTKPFSEAHFATFPPDLIEPCILAGCPKDVCSKCGKARERILRPSEMYKKMLGRDLMKKNEHNKGEVLQKGMCLETMPKACANYETVGFTDCGCGEGFKVGIVLDPFMGSGTTALVAAQNGRNYIGCELNPEYIKIAQERLQPLYTGVPVKEARAGQMSLLEVTNASK